MCATIGTRTTCPSRAHEFASAGNEKSSSKRLASCAPIHETDCGLRPLHVESTGSVN